MWERLLDRMLFLMIADGHLRLEMPSGHVFEYGNSHGNPVDVRLHDTASVRALVLNPELALGETYMRGGLTVSGDRIEDLLELVIRNIRTLPRAWWMRPTHRLRAALRSIAQFNPLARSRRNVAHHYDLSGHLYDQFLDADRQYSCAYFRHPDDSLERAQDQKKEHIARKLLLEPGMTVLDIGCGWGGLALYMAKHYGVRVLGITLSTEQLEMAQKRAERSGLGDLVEFRLCDYRELGGTYDRIVSVGMFEHVGLPHYDRFFSTLHDLLAPDGVAVLHTIGWTGAPKATNPWIAKYIFPGGYIPTLSEAMTAIEKAGLWAADVECWRLHYAYTLQHWRKRFEANRDTVKALYDAEFVRMWRFYLNACEQTFRHNRQAVFQFQLSRKVDAVPLTRDYLYQERREYTAMNAAE